MISNAQICENREMRMTLRRIDEERSWRLCVSARSSLSGNRGTMNGAAADAFHEEPTCRPSEGVRW